MSKPATALAESDAAETLSVVVEREFAFPPEKVWRALTQPHLIEAWLLKNDFVPAVDHRFSLRADWGTVECQVRAIEPQRRLAYTFAANGVDTVVTWTLTPAGRPVGSATHLRMEQVGFRPDQKPAYGGARQGWPRFLASLDQVLARVA